MRVITNTHTGSIVSDTELGFKGNASLAEIVHEITGGNALLAIQDLGGKQ